MNSGLLDRAVPSVDDFFSCNAVACALPCLRNIPTAAFPPPFTPPWRLGLVSLVSLSACSAGKSADKALVRVAVQPVTAMNITNSVVLTGDIQARKVTEQAFRVPASWSNATWMSGTGCAPIKCWPGWTHANRRTIWPLSTLRSRFGNHACTWQSRIISVSKYCSPKAIPTSASTRKPARAWTALAGIWPLCKRNGPLRVIRWVAVADGVITARHAEEGQVVQAATPVFSLRVLCLRVAVAQRSDRRVNHGEPAGSAEYPAERCHPRNHSHRVCRQRYVAGAGGIAGRRHRPCAGQRGQRTP